jgi:sugar phosphate isomerase/epimerase
MSIYFSTGGYKNHKTKYVVNELVKIGIKNIELSGTMYSPRNIHFLSKNFKKVNFQVHNYFPPPKNPIVLNLASFDKDVYKKTYDHIINSLEVCRKLNSKYYSFHAGFLCDLAVSELGKKVKKKKLQNRKTSLELFIKRVNKISAVAKKYNINLMIENNVLSKNNLKNFNENPFLMCDAEECREIISKTPKNVKLLVDVAHLKVSSTSLNFDKENFLSECGDLIGGYHLSDNNGFADTNEKFNENAWFWKHLKKDKKYYSIEVYNISGAEIVSLYKLTKKKLKID